MSYAKKCVLHHCYLALRPKVGVKVKGRGLRSTFWRAAVNIRGSALPSAAKSNRSHYQSKVFFCMSVISGYMQIITQMRSNSI